MYNWSYETNEYINNKVDNKKMETDLILKSRTELRIKS